MLEISIDPLQIRRLQQTLNKGARRLDSELKIAVRATLKKTRSMISKDVRKELAISAKGLKDVTTIHINHGRNPSGVVTLKKTKRPSLKRYGARHIKSGVSYRISKTKGRRRVADAFMGPRPGTIATKLGGHVFKRTGKNRYPIAKLHGPSPWAVFKRRRLRRPTIQATRIELRKQIERRIRFHVLKSRGEI